MTRLLVVANETLSTRDVREVIAARISGAAVDAHVLVIAPALTTRVAFWSSVDREARRAAEARLRRCLDELEDAGVAAEARSATPTRCSPSRTPSPSSRRTRS